MLDKFTSNSFFNYPAEKVYHYKVETTLVYGKITQTRTLVSEIKAKVIRPMGSKELIERGLKKGAVLNTFTELNFYETQNASDIIVWQGKFYRIRDKLIRRDYEYRYALEYLNEDELDPVEPEEPEIP